jgi:hypothetical protein
MSKLGRGVDDGRFCDWFVGPAVVAAGTSTTAAGFLGCREAATVNLRLARFL